MGSLKATLCAGTALLAASAPATAYAAYTGDTDQVTVTPATPAPGTDVTLRVPDCAERTAVAVSAAFESDVRFALASSDGALVGAGRVRASVEAGAYAVKVRCGSQQRTGRLTVGERAGRAPAAPATAASPVAPVDAGGGGAHLAATDAGNARGADDSGSGARPDGPGTAHAVTGLVLAGVAAVAVALRSARRSRGTD